MRALVLALGLLVMPVTNFGMGMVGPRAAEVQREAADYSPQDLARMLMEVAAIQDEPVRRRLPYKLDNDPVRAELMRRMGPSAITPECAAKSADHSLRSGLIPPEWRYKPRTRTD
jgi:hypothetical protein